MAAITNETEWAAGRTAGKKATDAAAASRKVTMDQFVANEPVYGDTTPTATTTTTTTATGDEPESTEPESTEHDATTAA